MVDIRLQRMAQVLVNYSLGIKKGDRLSITGYPSATPLIQEIVREALHAGGHPETSVILPGLQEMVLREASDEQLHYIPATRRIVNDEYEATLYILSQDNTKYLSGIDPARIALMQQA